MVPELILINPWIYDFAAYDLWSKPLGLLYLASYLRECGFRIHLIDCLDVYHSGMKKLAFKPPPVRRLYGTGKFWREKVAKPRSLRHINRSYSRYGITRQLFINELRKIRQPAGILVTSLMTYWYPGVQEVISLAKEVHPDVPVFTGGIYARLCEEHARQSLKADCIITEGILNKPTYILKIMHDYGVPVPDALAIDSEFPYPAFDMLSRIDYICIITSMGCPYQCQYCASRFLNPSFIKREPGCVLEEILYWHKNYGVQDFAFYDDALMIDSQSHIAVILEELIRRNLNLRFHTPNGLHIREITLDMAELLYRAGFRSIRLGLETWDMQVHDDLDKKVSEGEFEKAVKNLKKAGFTRKEIGAYILMGLPRQSVDSVFRTILLANETGVAPYLAEYSPLPHTPLWQKALSYSAYDLLSEPLFHNNTLLPCWDEMKKEKVHELKKMVREFRQRP